jgi:multicomponent Na+:H+ antiporter subunit D
LHLEGKREHFSALIYVGSAIGVVFAGDFTSLYIFWEFMAVASVMLIWARKEISGCRLQVYPRSYSRGAYAFSRNPVAYS